MTAPASPVADRVRETSSTTGTGSMSLAGAVTGFQSFSSGIGNGNTCYYTISNTGVNEWEVGVGTYATTGNLLVRTTILKSSNNNYAVDFSVGVKDIFVTYPAQKSVYLDTSGNASSLGIPAAFTATNVTGLPISTGVSGLGTGVATALSINVGSAGAPVVNGGALGTPASGDLSNCSIPPTSISSVTGLGTGVATALAVNVGSAGAVITNGGALGTPSSGTLTSATGLPISTGVSGLGTGVATALAVNVGSAGALVINGGALGTPSSGTLTSATGLPISTGVSGLGTGVATALAVNTGSAGAFVVNGGTMTNQTITNYTESVVSIGNSGTSKTLDLTNGTVQTVTMTGNCTFTMPTAVAGKGFILVISSGAGSFTGVFTSVKWPANTAPTITTTASRWDILAFESDGTYWYGTYQLAYQ